MRLEEHRVFRLDSGYTVVELLILLVVLAASAMIVGPRVSASRDAIAVDVAAQRLATALMKARASSISDSVPHEFVLEPARRGYRSEYERNLRQLERGISMSVSGFASDSDGARIRIRFKPDGTATSGKIFLSKSRSAVSIAVDWLSGAVRVRRLG
jgi:general secretion pathway protein H